MKWHSVLCVTVSRDERGESWGRGCRRQQLPPHLWHPERRPADGLLHHAPPDDVLWTDTAGLAADSSRITISCCWSPNKERLAQSFSSIFFLLFSFFGFWTLGILVVRQVRAIVFWSYTRSCFSAVPACRGFKVEGLTALSPQRFNPFCTAALKTSWNINWSSRKRRLYLMCNTHPVSQMFPFSSDCSPGIFPQPSSSSSILVDAIEPPLRPVEIPSECLYHESSVKSTIR